MERREKEEKSLRLQEIRKVTEIGSRSYTGTGFEKQVCIFSRSQDFSKLQGFRDFLDHLNYPKQNSKIMLAAR